MRFLDVEKFYLMSPTDPKIQSGPNHQSHGANCSMCHFLLLMLPQSWTETCGPQCMRNLYPGATSLEASSRDCKHPGWETRTHYSSQDDAISGSWLHHMRPQHLLVMLARICHHNIMSYIVHACRWVLAKSCAITPQDYHPKTVRFNIVFFLFLLLPYQYSSTIGVMIPSLFHNVAGLGSSNTDVQVVKERVRGGASWNWNHWALIWRGYQQ